MLTDPIADMLTRIRNGGRARLRSVRMPESRTKRELARVLTEHGYLLGFESDGDAKKPQLSIGIRYDDRSQPIIEGLQRVSKPGCRVYVGVEKIPTVRNGLGIAILSTPRGIMSDTQAREARVGGEVLVEVW